MPNQDLLKYIKDSLAQNVPKEEIKRAVLEVGWAEADIATAFLVAEGGVAPIVQPEPATVVQAEPTPVVVERAPAQSMPMATMPTQTPRTMPSAPSNNSQPMSMAQPSAHHGTLLWVMGTIIVALLVAGGVAIWVVMNNKGEMTPQGVVESVASIEQVPVVVVQENNVATSSVVVKPAVQVVDNSVKPIQKVTSNPIAVQVKISGVVSDDPLSGATVIVKSASGTKLATGTTDSHGRYSVMVAKQSIQSGYEITATGGRVGAKPFSGTLMALYSPSDNLSASNVTLITTLVSKLSESSSGKTRIEKRNTAVSRVAAIGIVSREKWSDLEYSSLEDIRELRRAVSDEGAKSWLTTMVADLADDDLAAENMRPFPSAHGGIVSLGFGGWGIPEEFKGSEFNRKLSVSGPEGSIYSYKLINGPGGLKVDAQGGVYYKISDTAPTGRVSFQIKVSNNLGSRIFRGVVYVMDTSVVASGVVPVEGGKIADAWEDVILTVPGGVLTESTSVSVLRGTQENGYYSFTFKSSPTINGPVYLKTPNIELRKMELEQQK